MSEGDPRQLVLALGRALVEEHARATGYRAATTDLVAYTRIVREKLVTRDRVLNAELEAWAERAVACEPRVAVASLEQILFPHSPASTMAAPRLDASDRPVLAFSAIAIAAVVFAGAMAARDAGTTFTFTTPSRAPVERAEGPRVALAKIAAQKAEDDDDAALCIEAREHACVRALLLPRVDSLSKERRHALRLACAALEDYGCVLRVDSLRDR